MKVSGFGLRLGVEVFGFQVHGLKARWDCQTLQDSKFASERFGIVQGFRFWGRGLDVAFLVLWKLVGLSMYVLDYDAHNLCN